MNLIISDIDGVVADCSHRMFLVDGENKLWKSFYSDEYIMKDTPREAGIEFIKHLSGTCNFDKIVFCTGRNETCREATKHWLRKHVSNDYHSLWMRKEFDHRKGVETKPELVAEILRSFEAMGVDVQEIYYIDDDPKIVKAVVESISDWDITGITFGIERMEEDEDNS